MGFYDGLTPDQRTIHDALCDSAWLAGVGAGWNAACHKDSTAADRALATLQASRNGYLLGFKEASDRLRK